MAMLKSGRNKLSLMIRAELCRIDFRCVIAGALIVLACGILSALAAGPTVAYYELVKPRFAPPRFLFPIVWTILYLLMGYASYRIWTSDAPGTDKRGALLLYGAQLLANFIWPLLFFGGEMFLAALIWLVFLWILIFLSIRAFSKIDERAGDLLIPYILWVTFAAYLNLGIYLLN